MNKTLFPSHNSLGMRRCDCQHLLWGGECLRRWPFYRSHWLHVAKLCFHPCLSDTKYSASSHGWAPMVQYLCASGNMFSSQQQKPTLG